MIIPFVLAVAPPAKSHSAPPAGRTHRLREAGRWQHGFPGLFELGPEQTKPYREVSFFTLFSSPDFKGEGRSALCFGGGWQSWSGLQLDPRPLHRHWCEKRNLLQVYFGGAQGDGEETGKQLSFCWRYSPFY